MLGVAVAVVTCAGVLIGAHERMHRAGWFPTRGWGPCGNCHGRESRVFTLS